MASIRRNLKNASKNYAPCERDVREATSNDHKLASAIVMARISNATYDVSQSPLVMAMLWKRLNDIGKNWRHCYKGLILLDYLLKTGADHIVSEVKANKFALESLMGFQFVDGKGVDKGINVRERAKLTMDLIEDDERLQDERDKALAAHRRLTQNLGRAAEPKPVQASRQQALSKRGMVMPNGDAPPDPREEERRQIERAREASAAEYIQREGLEAAFSPVRGTSPLGADAPPPDASEEEQLAYALQVSALEAQSPTGTAPAVASAPAAVDNDAALARREEEELALALSLSMADQQPYGGVIDSDDESAGNSVTPVTSPYTGDFFGAVPPSYSEASEATSPTSPEFGITPNRAVNTTSSASHDVDSHSDIGGLHAAELEQYLALEESVGRPA